MEANNKQDRIAWVDTMRFLGMLAIYVGHFGGTAGRLYPFVFIYHVPLFFFLSGFFAPDGTLPEIARRLFKRLLLPYVFFCLLDLVALVIVNDWSWIKVRETLPLYALGIRNTMPAGALWFFPCLFIVALAFAASRRLVTPRPVLLLLIGVALMVVAEHLLPFRPTAKPSWAFNADSALYYFFWYVLGSTVFPYLQRWSRHPMFRTITWLAVVCAIGIYFGWAQRLMAPRGPVSGSVVWTALIATLILANIAIAQALDGALLRKLGRRTLVLCGTEDFTKLVLPHLLGIVGLHLTIANPLAALAYSFACLLIAGFGIGTLLDRHAPVWTGLRKAPSGSARPGTTSIQA